MKSTASNKIYPAYERSQGVALIMAILITSLVSIAAVAMVTQQQLEIRRTQNILHFDQAYIYVLGAEDWAKGFLSQDTSPNHDYYPVSEDNPDVIGLPIAEEVKQSGLDIGGISGIITDASASFPLNMLVDDNGARNTPYWEVFDHLVANNLESISQLHNLVLDWIDKDDNVSLGGAEDTEYLNLPKNPYRAANNPIASVSEMRLMLALSEDTNNAKNDYAALARPSFNPLNAVSLEAIEQQPLVNALPRGAKININTAPKAVLRALVDYVDLTDAETLVKEFDDKRKETPQENTDGFIKPISDEVEQLRRSIPTRTTGNSRLPSGGAANTQVQNPVYTRKKAAVEKLKEMVDVKSEYFYLTARSQIGDTDVLLISLLHRKDGRVTTLRRGIGVL